MNIIHNTEEENFLLNIISNCKEKRLQIIKKLLYTEYLYVLFTLLKTCGRDVFRFLQLGRIGNEFIIISKKFFFVD